MNNLNHSRTSMAWLFPVRPLLLLLFLMLPAVVQAQFNYTDDGWSITITGYYGPGGAVVRVGSRCQATSSNTCDFGSSRRNT